MIHNWAIGSIWVLQALKFVDKNAFQHYFFTLIRVFGCICTMAYLLLDCTVGIKGWMARGSPTFWNLLYLPGREAHRMGRKIITLLFKVMFRILGGLNHTRSPTAQHSAKSSNKQEEKYAIPTIHKQ